MSYTVRDAHGYEVDKLASLVHRVWDESIYAPLTFDHGKTANLLVEGILHRPGWYLKVIEHCDSGEPVGGLLGRLEVIATSPDSVAYDISMMIDKDHRGKCIKQFIELMHDFAEWGKNNGAKIIKVGVSSGIKVDSASAFLERLGFKRAGSMHSMIVGE